MRVQFSHKSSALGFSMMIHRASIVDGFRLPAVPHSTAEDISISGIPIMPISFSRVSRQGWKTYLHRDNHVLSKTTGVEPASRPERMKKPLLLPIKLRFAPVCKQPYVCIPHTFKRSYNMSSAYHGTWETNKTTGWFSQCRLCAVGYAHKQTS